MTIGIYSLYFEEIDSKVYIGQSVNIEKRYKDHKSALQTQKHTNYKLQEAYNLYGFPQFSVIEKCSFEELDILEIFWTNEFDSIINGLNICYPGKGAASGPDNHNSKYSRLQILRVFRKLYLSNELSDNEIGLLYNVHSSTVTNIRLGHSHLWLKDSYPAQYKLIKQYRITKTRANALARNLIPGGVKIRDPLGNIHNVYNMREFARINNLDGSNISKLCRGKVSTVKGWTKA